MTLDELINKGDNMRYLITTAQKGAIPNRRFLESLEVYSVRHKAEILILPSNGRCVDDDSLHPEFAKYRTITSDYNLTKAIKISNYEIRAQMIKPLTGLRRFAAGDKSFIFASPKQVLEYVPTAEDGIPKAIMTTGAVTMPFYNLKNRVGRIAEKDHEFGAIMVETKNATHYAFRQIKAFQNGKFSDIDGLYSPKGYKKANSVEALVLGDIHPYQTDSIHEKCSFDQIAKLKPRRLFLHDTFNGMSISHHLLGHNIEAYNTWESQGLNLNAELKETARVITKYANAMAMNGGDVYVVASNHDEFLRRYLDEGRFIGDTGNDLEGSILYTAALMGHNPFKYAMHTMYSVPENVIFLERDSSLKVRGFELANHGDLGANGSRGSLTSIENANGKSISGHRHSAAKIRDTYTVGTSTKYRLGYNRGYSNWSQTNAVLYDTGHVQLLNTIKRTWK